eukprot:9094154-Ditylum_brightwellii.AAC.1
MVTTLPSRRCCTVGSSLRFAGSWNLLRKMWRAHSICRGILELKCTAAMTSSAFARLFPIHHSRQ